MDVLENFLSCTVYKTGKENKRNNFINLIGLLGENKNINKISNVL